MKIEINIQVDTPEEAANIFARISGSAAAVAEVSEAPTPTEKKAPAKKAPAKKAAPKQETVEVEAEVVEPTPEPECPTPEPEAPAEPTHTEATVTAKAKELVAIASPAVLRAVLDEVIGAGVKISGMPKEKFDELYIELEKKIADINAV